MGNLVEILINSVNMIFDCADVLLSSLSDGGLLWAAGSGVTLAFALGAVVQSNISEGILAGARRWHGNIDDQFSSIGNLVDLIQEKQWTLPQALLAELLNNYGQLKILIPKCRTNAASARDREHRNVLLKSTVGLCLHQVKLWAYGEYAAGTLTAEDIHNLGFLLPGENGGHHSRTEATRVMAEVSVRVLSSDLIHVVVDQSGGENAAQVVHGWPTGVKQALIVIVSADTKTEVIRQMTTHLHNDIQMPEGSQGKQFVIKAAFLKHIDDTPHFGNEPTFSMPLTTEDLIHIIDRQHHEDFEARVQAVDAHRRELESLSAADADAKE
ncbi:MAG: hypothetical protein LBL33_09990 [Tannerella sp.]|jgi:hypothetical protein|nr:hypothetical protein [Tannerella sp.]